VTGLTTEPGVGWKTAPSYGKEETVGNDTVWGEVGDGQLAGLMAVASLLGAGVSYGVKWYMDYRKSSHEREDAVMARRRAEAKEDQQTIVDHMKVTVDRLDAENAGLRKEVKECRTDLTKVTAHVMYLEGIMEAKGVHFRPLVLASVPRQIGVGPFSEIETHGPPLGGGEEEES
jgi:hypothetical protein